MVCPRRRRRTQERGKRKSAPAPSATQLITALLGSQERFAPLTRVLPHLYVHQATASGSASRSASIFLPEALAVSFTIQARARN